MEGKVTLLLEVRNPTPVKKRVLGFDLWLGVKGQSNLEDSWFLREKPI